MPSPTTRRAVISTALASLLACAVLLTLLGHARLTDWDEGIYAGISRAMLSTGWLVPHWNGQPWLEKPPLELWLTALSFRVFGLSEFSARLVSALSGVVLVGVLHVWLLLRRGALAAWLNTLILLSTFGFQHVARVGEMDVLLSLGSVVALIGLCELRLSARRGWLLFWAGFAVALMTKGAASVTLPITLALWLGAEWVSDKQIPTGVTARKANALFCGLGLALFLALVLPWHVAMWHRFGGEFTTQYLGLHVLTRATSQIEGHMTPWYFYLRVLLFSAAPWVLLYPAAVWVALRRDWLQPFAIFALVVLVLFSVALTRLPHYIAPAYPAFAVLAAVWIAERVGPWLSGASGRSTLLRFAAVAMVCYAVGALLTAGPRKSLHAARLANGDTTPDNREQIALLKEVFQHPAPEVKAIGGPLLTLRTGSYNPIPTTVFYSGREVQQVVLTPIPLHERIDIYTNSPVPLGLAMEDHRPHLLLADRAVLQQLPRDEAFQALATGPTLALGVLTPR